MLAFHCLLLVLLAGQASAVPNPDCVTVVCKNNWPEVTPVDPTQLLQAQKRFFDRETFINAWEPKNGVDACTSLRNRTRSYRDKVNIDWDIKCQPWGSPSETWCPCRTKNAPDKLYPNANDDFNSAAMCDVQEGKLSWDSQSLYDVEHVIDKKGPEREKEGRKTDIYGNVVMAWAEWNQQLGAWKTIPTTYEMMQKEKQMIYGKVLWEAAQKHTIDCTTKADTDGDTDDRAAAKKQRTDDQLDTEPSPGMSKATLNFAAQNPAASGPGLVNASLPDIKGTTPLGAAAKNGHVEVVKVLLASDQVNPNERSLDGRTPLFIAAENGHLDVVKVLLASDQVNPNERSLDGRTPLFIAAENGHTAVVNTLLAYRPTNHTASGCGNNAGA